MHPEQMLQRAPHSPMAGTGWIHGWRLTFGGEDVGWEGALATLVEDPLSSAHPRRCAVPDLDEKVLDEWESYPQVREKIGARAARSAWASLGAGPAPRAYEGGMPSCRL